MRQLILPATRLGAIVLCDRFIDSTSAYQGEALRPARSLSKPCTSLPCKENAESQLFLDLDVKRSFARLRQLKPELLDDDRFEAENEAFHQRVREGFLKLAAKQPGRIKTFDASLPKSELAARILQEVRNVIG